jgi:hypothetical protein
MVAECGRRSAAMQTKYWKRVASMPVQGVNVNLRVALEYSRPCEFGAHSATDAINVFFEESASTNWAAAMGAEQTATATVRSVRSMPATQEGRNWRLRKRPEGATLASQRAGIPGNVGSSWQDRAGQRLG